ncbi:MAG: hypothetical protein OXF50_18930 [Caldilineaceae bacterium]|nr:hypothetical protein [Caldilineaceae bacterium]
MGGGPECDEKVVRVGFGGIANSPTVTAARSTDPPYGRSRRAGLDRRERDKHGCGSIDGDESGSPHTAGKEQRRSSIPSPRTTDSSVLGLGSASATVKE